MLTQFQLCGHFLAVVISGVLLDSSLFQGFISTYRRVYLINWPPGVKLLMSSVCWS